MKRFVVLVALLVSSGYASAGRTLTLEECRELAIQNNKELKISGEKIKMAGYEKNAAFTKYFPQLSATGAYMWNQKDINLLDMGARRFYWRGSRADRPIAGVWKVDGRGG